MQFMRVTFRIITLATTLSILSACTTTVDNLLPDRRPDYRQSRTEDPLEVPPDLTASTIDDTLVVPELNPTASASLSDYASERAGSQRLVTDETVLQDQPGMQLQRDGEQRWLVVQQAPEQLWPKIKEFWTDNGLPLAREEPRIGIMETNWLENRADIPSGPIRAILSRVIDFAYSAPTRDKFRVRLERVPDGSGTEVYLTHYGVEEVVQSELAGRRGSTTDVALWQSRPRDPELEAEMLNRLMVHLGASERQAATQLAEATSPQGPRARLLGDDGAMLVIEEDYAHAWRLVGLALDGSNFVVEDQDRAQGLYVVEYSDPLDDGKEKGFLSRLAFWKNDPPPQGIRYQVRLAGRGPQTLVVVHNAEGQPDNSRTAQLILDSLIKVIN